MGRPDPLATVRRQRADIRRETAEFRRAVARGEVPEGEFQRRADELAARWDRNENLMRLLEHATFDEED